MIDNSELKKTYDILQKDVEKAVEEGKREASPYIRRAHIRAFFALVEGLIYQLKQICLQFSEYDDKLFIYSELALLREESYEIHDNGTIVSRTKFIPILKNIKFAVKCYAKAHNSNFSLTTNENGWHSFICAVKIRNRITHPKRSADLTITDEDLTKIGEASAWYKDSIVALLKSCSEYYNRKA